MAVDTKAPSAEQAFPDPNRVDGTPAAVQTPQLPRLEPWLDVAPDVYPGFRMRVSMDFSSATWRDVDSLAGEERRQECLRQIVLEHNGWRKADGTPFPDAQAAEFWQEVPERLGIVIIQRIAVELRSLPNSLKAMRRS